MTTSLSGQYQPYNGPRDVEAMKRFAINQFPHVRYINTFTQIDRSLNTLCVICVEDDICMSGEEAKMVRQRHWNHDILKEIR